MKRVGASYDGLEHNDLLQSYTFLLFMTRSLKLVETEKFLIALSSQSDMPLLQPGTAIRREHSGRCLLVHGYFLSRQYIPPAAVCSLEEESLRALLPDPRWPREGLLALAPHVLQAKGGQ